MKHAITISPETLVAIDNYKSAKALLNAHDQTIKNAQNNLLLPSGRARKGGRKDLYDLLDQRDLISKNTIDLANVASTKVRSEVNDAIYNVCRNNLERMTEYVEGDTLLIVRAAIEAFNDKETGKRTISIAHSIEDYSYDFDVYCSYDHNGGLAINVTKKDGGRWLSGSVVCVRRNESTIHWKEREERFSVIEQYIENGVMYVTIPPSFLDGAYFINVGSQDEVCPEYAVCVARLVQAASRICKDLAGSMRVEAYHHAAFEVIHS